MEKLIALLTTTIAIKDDDALFDINYKAILEYYNVLMTDFNGLQAGLLGKVYQGKIVQYREASDIIELKPEEKLLNLKILLTLVNIL